MIALQKKRSKKFHVSYVPALQFTFRIFVTSTDVLRTSGTFGTFDTCSTSGSETQKLGAFRICRTFC